MEAVEERAPGMGGGELMGVYLPNVDMPKGDKVLTVQILPDGSIWQQYRGIVPNAKAVPIPPHGRLGDLDALCESKDVLDDVGWPDAFLPISTIEAAPTIIPAEPGEEETT